MSCVHPAREKIPNRQRIHAPARGPRSVPTRSGPLFFGSSAGDESMKALFSTRPKTFAVPFCAGARDAKFQTFPSSFQIVALAPLRFWRVSSFRDIFAAAFVCVNVRERSVFSSSRLSLTFSHSARKTPQHQAKLQNTLPRHLTTLEDPDTERLAFETRTFTVVNFTRFREIIRRGPSNRISSNALRLVMVRTQCTVLLGRTEKL